MNDKFRVSDLAENTDEGLNKFNGENKNIIKEENNKLIVAWIGKNADKILNINQNISALFLGELYFFYRKMYLQGIIILLLKLGLFIVLPYKYLVIILNMILFFITNSIYKMHIKRNIKRLKKKYSSSKIEKECIKRGGTSLYLFIIITVIEMALLSFYIYKTVDISQYINKPVVDKKKKPVVKKTKESTKAEKFNGKLVIKDLGYNDLDFGFPSHWKMEGSKAYYSFDSNKKDSSCSVELGTVDNYSNAKTLTQEVKDYYKIDDLTTTNKNSLDWYKLSYNEGETIIILGFSDLDGEIIAYRFTIEKNADEETCRQIEREIFRNIKPPNYSEEDESEE